jgi:hypothetical protein
MNAQAAKPGRAGHDECTGERCSRHAAMARLLLLRPVLSSLDHILAGQECVPLLLC